MPPPGGGAFWGTIFSAWKRWPPRPPRKDAWGRVSTLSPKTPSQRPKEGDCGPPPLEITPGCSQERGMTPAAHFVAPPGFVLRRTRDERRAADSRPYKEGRVQAISGTTYPLHKAHLYEVSRIRRGGYHPPVHLSTSKRQEKRKSPSKPCQGLPLRGSCQRS